MAITDFAHQAHETLVRNNHAARALNRLHDERSDRVRTLELHLILKQPGNIGS